MRGRNRNNKGPNPLTRSYESNGPDVKIRGTAQHVAEKYSQLARDAQASGDPVAAENYLQHAEHYFRIIAAAQEQLREQYGYQRDEEGDEDGFAGDRAFGNGEDMDPAFQPQPYDGEPRQPRFDRQDRGERQDRGSDRPDRGERQDRGDRGDRRERFQRDRGPRQEFQRDGEGRGDRPERAERPDRAERQDRGERPDRGGGEFRRERVRRDEQPEASDAGLPAFLTNPVRAPVAVENDDAPVAEGVNGDANGDFRSRRRRRRGRGFGEEGGSDFAPEAVETPPAE
jgi:hypothetical protein